MADVYTKTGDKGTTGLYTGERVSKASLRVDVYGTIDELDSALGMARAFATNDDVRETVYTLQKYLWLLMADVSSIDKEPNITDTHVAELETIIDGYDEKLEPLSKFIVPGDTQGAATLDVARTVTRRAERLMWKLAEESTIHESNVRFLNRLSDLCFILGRVESEL